jgi:RDD family protein
VRPLREDGPQGVQVASLGRRVCAGLIDTVVFGPPILAVSIGGAWLYVRYRGEGGTDVEQLRSLVTSTRSNVVIWSASAVVRVQTRNWRTPGYRALGLRRVDVRTGGPLSARNVLVEQAVAIASGQLRRWGVKEFYEDNRVNVGRSCWPPLLGAVVMQAPVLWSPLNQTVPERLAGIVVVQD